MTQSFIRVADLMDALKDKPQDARVTIMVYSEGYHHEAYISDIYNQPNFGPGKVILVGDV